MVYQDPGTSNAQQHYTLSNLDDFPVIPDLSQVSKISLAPTFSPIFSNIWFAICSPTDAFVLSLILIWAHLLRGWRQTQSLNQSVNHNFHIMSSISPCCSILSLNVMHCWWSQKCLHKRNDHIDQVCTSIKVQATPQNSMKSSKRHRRSLN